MPASSELDLVANTAIDLVANTVVFFLAHLFWPSSLGEGGYTALEALAVAV